MPVTIQKVEKIARLAKLQFSKSEKEKIARQLDQIVVYMNKLNELETESVQPVSHVVGLKNIFREDKCEPWLQQEEALANAPESKKGYFSVPKVIKKS